MNWLKNLSKVKTRYKYLAQMFVFDEISVAHDYADFLTSIHEDNDADIVSEDSNWDQAGIRTTIIIYRRKEKML